MRITSLPLLVLLCATGYCEAACEAWLDAAPVFETTHLMGGGTPVELKPRLPASARLLVVARESGIDIVLQVKSGTRVLAQGDSPNRRMAAQHVLLNTSATGAYSLVLRSKERPEVTGSVEVKVVALPPAVSESCLQLLDTLAKADAAYANAETTGAAESSAAAYQSSADGYVRVANQLEGGSATRWLAPVQLAAAGAFYKGFVNWSAAEKWAEQARRAYESLGDLYGRARAQALRAAALMEIREPVAELTAPGSEPGMQNLDLARALLRTVIAFHLGRGEQYDQATATNNLGLSYHLSSDYAQAATHYRAALQIYRTIADARGQIQVQGNLAVIDYDLGLLSSAMARYEEVLLLTSEADDLRQFVNVLNNHAMLSDVSGNSDQALRTYGRALELARKHRDKYYEAVSLQGLGATYDTLGEYERALQFLQQALDLRTREADARGRAETLWSRAKVLRQLGRAAEALQSDREALQLAASAVERARIAIQIAKDLSAVGRVREAREQLDAVIGQRSAGDRFVNAKALLARAELDAASGEWAKATQAVSLALPVFQRYEAGFEQFAALVLTARVQQQSGRLQQALQTTDAALQLAEELRLQTANPKLRANVLASLREAFDVRIEIFAQRAFAATSAADRQRWAKAALETAERARGRALREYLVETNSAASGGQSQQRHALMQALQEHRARLQDTGDKYPTDDPVLQRLRSNLASLRHRLDQLEAGAPPVRIAALTVPQAAIPPDCAMIEYWLGGRQAFAWVLTRDDVLLVRLPEAGNIAASAQRVLQAARDFGITTHEERLHAIDELSRLVWRPIEPHIGAKKRLIFAPDQSLHFVPFAALRSTQAERARFLVEDRDVAITPSLAMLLQPRNEDTATAPQDMLLVDDPVYGPRDPRVMRSAAGPAVPSLAALQRGPAPQYPPRLPGAAAEADIIARLWSGGRVERLSGFAAARNALLSKSLERYRYIHLALHAVADPQIPQLSAMLLSSVDAQGRAIEGRLFADDLLRMRLRADLVVLSACDTAVGRSVAGEGLMGLQYMMLARGAGSVASSLWMVQDSTTANFMKVFYQGLFQQRRPAMSAMSDAMRAALRQRRNDMALWGAFQLTLARL